MTRAGRPIAAAAAVLLGCSITIARAGNASMAPALVEFAHGTTALPAGTPVTAGDPLPEGTRLHVPEDGYLRLRLADGSVVNVLARSDVQLRRLRRHRTTGRSETIIDVRRGKVESDVVPQKEGRVFEIRAPGAVASVRGTRFDMSVDPDGQVRAAVTEGEIFLRSRRKRRDGGAASTTTVRAGQGVVLDSHGRPIRRHALPSR
jgi:hypothetical protein